MDFTLYSKVCTKSFDIFPFIIVDFVVHVFVDVVIVVALVFRFVFDHKLGKQNHVGNRGKCSKGRRVIRTLLTSLMESF